MCVGVVLGTRPEIIKNFSLIRELRRRGADVKVFHTNQHCSHAMSGAIFEEMGYQADFVLNKPYRLGTAIDWLGDKIRELGLKLIIVNGDTAAAAVGALAAMYEDVEVAHVEAGLRSFDKTMREERNRIIVDAVAQYLFTYTEYETAYLKGIPDLRGRVYCVGNTTIDVVHEFSHKLLEPPTKDYAYVTLHRKELTDDLDQFQRVLDSINEVGRYFDEVIFPVHPRTNDAMQRSGLDPSDMPRLGFRTPLTAFESLSYIKHATVVITDSGCVQEEAYIFGVPCVTLRENTERHLTVHCGANIVSGFEREGIQAAVRRHLQHPPGNYPAIYGGPGVGSRIVDVLLNRGGNAHGEGRMANEG